MKDGIHFNDEGDLIIPVRSIPFGNQKSTDLDQQFFDKDTKLGDVTEHYVFFDHDDSWLPPEMRFVNPIGKSYITHTDDSGIFERLVIDRRTKFIKNIHDLFKAGVLDASTVAEWGSLDPKVKGRIAEWGWKRTDITPTNSDARATLAKNFSGALNMEEEKKEETKTTEGEQKQEEKKEEKEKTSVAENLKNIFSQAEEDVRKQLEDKNQSATEIAAVLETVKSGFASVSGKIDELQKTAGMVPMLQEEIKKMDGRFTDIEMGLEEFAKSVAKRIHGMTAEDLQKSQAERNAENELRRQAELQKNKDTGGQVNVNRGAPGWEKSQ